MRDLRHLDAAAAQDLTDWIFYLELDEKRPKTIYEYVRAIAPLLRNHPEKKFREFTDMDIMAELVAIPSKSRYVRRSIYNSWFNWGVDHERLDRNPMLGKVPRMKEPHREPKDVFTDAERATLEALPSPDGELFTILFGTGLRRGEARRLRRGNIDLNRAVVAVVNGKGGKDRKINAPPQVLAAVSDLDLFERLDHSDHLWYRGRYEVGDPRRRGPGPIGDTTFEDWYKRGILRAGVRYLNPHQTRHTYGWWLRSEGFDIEERQFLMGHKNTNTTVKYYGRMSVDDLREKIAALT